jgi:hypothetical protein
MMRKRLLMVCGLIAVVWLAAFTFHYYAINRGCWFPTLSLAHRDYICGDPPQFQTILPASDFGALTPTPAAIVEIAAAQALGNTIDLMIIAGLAAAAAFGGTKAFRKLRDHR